VLDVGERHGDERVADAVAERRGIGVELAGEPDEIATQATQRAGVHTNLGHNDHAMQFRAVALEVIHNRRLDRS